MAKTLALVIGIVIILVGALGFLPNPIVGAGAMIETNSLLNIIYIVFGVVLAGAALRMPGQSRMWLKVVGALYLLLAIAGFVVAPNGGTILGLVDTNFAGHLLHVVLGVVLLVAGFIGKGGAKAPASMPQAPAAPPSNPPMGGM